MAEKKKKLESTMDVGSEDIEGVELEEDQERRETLEHAIRTEVEKSDVKKG